jgi:hypothetical protein
MTDILRRAALRRILAGAVLSVSSISIVEAAADKSTRRRAAKRATVARAGAKSRLRLKGGKSLNLTKKGVHWYAAPATIAVLKKSRLRTPTLRLANGKLLKFDRKGRLLKGSVGNRSFLEIIDD